MKPSSDAMIAAFVAAALVSLGITPFVIRLAAARRWFDNPRGGERSPAREVSRLGGIVVFIAACVGVSFAILFGAISLSPDRVNFLLGLFVGGFAAFLLGLFDDLHGARARTKLIVLSVAATVVYAFGTRIGVVTLGGTFGVSTGWLAYPLTVLWIVGVTNAFNLIDGMDGLATGIGLVVLFAVMLAAFVLGNIDVVLVSVVLVGALTGFLRYNLNPARIFLGDSGSLFIGFMLSVLSMHGSLKSTTAVLVAIPIFALALPLLDTVVAILRRLIRGSPVFGADARHIHHRLLAVGFTTHRAAGLLCAVAACFAIIGLSIAFAPPNNLLWLAIAGGLVSTALVLFGVRRLEYVEFAEAAMTIARRGGGLRREIRQHIHAQETVLLIAEATSLDHVNSILTERASRFGFARMELHREEELHPVPPALPDRPMPRRLWKLDYPVGQADVLTPQQLMMRIWCDADSRTGTSSAERIAKVLARAIEVWVEKPETRLPPPRRVIERRRSPDLRLSIGLDGNGAVDSPWPTR